MDQFLLYDPQAASQRLLTRCIPPRHNLRGGYLVHPDVLIRYAEEHLHASPATTYAEKDTQIRHARLDVNAKAATTLGIVWIQGVSEKVGCEGECVVCTRFEHIDGWVGMEECEFPTVYEEDDFDRKVKRYVKEWLDGFYRHRRSVCHSLTLRCSNEDAINLKYGLRLWWHSRRVYT